MDKAKEKITIKVKTTYKNIKDTYEKAKNISENPSLCPELDKTTRLIGFIVCFFIGFFMTLSSITQLFTLVLGGERWFAIWYTAGNLVCLASSFFYMGPKQQMENILKPERKNVSFILVISMVSCVVFALLGFSKLLILIDIFIQCCALIWYVLSYVPNGQLCCKNMIKGAMKGEKEEESSTKYKEMV